MAKSQDQVLATLIGSLESFGDLLGKLNDRVMSLEQAVPELRSPLQNAVTDGAISTVFIGMLMAEIADGDQTRFDELMSRTASFAEARTQHLTGETKAALLTAIDRMVGVADDHFARRK